MGNPVCPHYILLRFSAREYFDFGETGLFFWETRIRYLISCLSALWDLGCLTSISLYPSLVDAAKDFEARELF